MSEKMATFRDTGDKLGATIGVTFYRGLALIGVKRPGTRGGIDMRRMGDAREVAHGLQDLANWLLAQRQQHIEEETKAAEILEVSNE